jgi:hypothetical protein
VDPNWVNLSNGGAISGVDTDTLIFTGVATSDAGQYRVHVTDSVNPGDPSDSNPAVVIVSTGPTQTAISGNKTTNAGGNATFQCTMSGTGTLTYRWYKSVNSVETLLFEGVNLDFINYTNIPCNDNGAEIICRVTDDCGTREGSPRAVLTVNNPTPLPEVCDNGIDDDCNGQTDCDDNACVSSPVCCNTPWADAEGPGGVGVGMGDGDIDGNDLAVFQLCYTGPFGTIPVSPAYCACLDRDQNGKIDSADFDAFKLCAPEGSKGSSVPGSCP